MSLKINNIFVQRQYNYQDKTTPQIKDFSQTTSYSRISELNRGYYLPVNFKCSDIEDYKNSLLNLEDIHCPICGTKTLNKELMEKAIEEGKNIVEKNEFLDWVQKYKDYVPQKNQKFVQDILEVAQNPEIKDTKGLLIATKAIAKNDLIKSLQEICNILEEKQKQETFSDDDKNKIAKCIESIENIKNSEIKHSIFYQLNDILKENILSLEFENKIPLYNYLMQIFIPASNYHKVFTGLGYDMQEMHIQEQTLRKLLISSLVTMNELFKEFSSAKSPTSNYILTCKDCSPTKEVPLYVLHRNREDLRENLVQYCDDIGRNVLNGTLECDYGMIFNQSRLISKILNNRFKLSQNETPIISQLNKLAFEKVQDVVKFEPVLHENVPCSSCGENTITHEQKVDFYEQIKNAKNNKEVIELLEKNINYVHKKHRSQVKIMSKLIKENPNISENEIISILRKEMADELKEKMLNNIKSMELIRGSLSESDQIFANKYIEMIKEKYFENGDDIFYSFIYEEYQQILMKTLFNIKNNTFRGIYVDGFKEVMRKAYAKQSTFYPKEQTVDKVGGALKVIAQDFFKASVATIDHLLAINKGGKNELHNYTVMCKSCNSDKGNYPFWHWISMNTLANTRVYMQKYLNRIIDLIQDGKLSDEYKDYPKEYAKHVKRLTDGKIKLNPKRTPVE